MSLAENKFGMVLRDNFVLTVENGRVKEAALGTNPCSDLSPSAK
jgi:hypothetical protein